jgi:hypothetical protein
MEPTKGKDDRDSSIFPLDLKGRIVKKDAAFLKLSIKPNPYNKI